MSVQFRPRVGGLVLVPRPRHGMFFYMIVLTFWVCLVLPIKLAWFTGRTLFYDLPVFLHQRGVERREAMRLENERATLRSYAAIIQNPSTVPTDMTKAWDE